MQAIKLLPVTNYYLKEERFNVILKLCKTFLTKEKNLQTGVT